MEKVDKNHKSLHGIEPIFTVAEKEAHQQWAYSPPLLRNLFKKFPNSTLWRFLPLGKITHPSPSQKKILFYRENVCSWNFNHQENLCCNEGFHKLASEGMTPFGCELDVAIDLELEM